MSATKTMQERDMQKVTSKQKIVKFFVQFLLYTFLIIMAIIIIFPFDWMLISSVKSLEEYKLAVPTLFPKQIFFSNYVEAFTTAKLGKLFLNTVIVGVVSTLLSLVITVLSAFAFARLEFNYRAYRIQLFGL